MKMESVSLRREVITGPSKAADYVNFTGHSLLGHAPPLPPFPHPPPLSLSLLNSSLTPSLSIMSPEESQVQMCIKSRDKQHSQMACGCCFLFFFPLWTRCICHFISPSNFITRRRGANELAERPGCTSAAAPLYTTELWLPPPPLVSQGRGGLTPATPALGSRRPRPLNCGGADENKVGCCREPRAVPVSQLRVQTTRQAPLAGSDAE